MIKRLFYRFHWWLVFRKVERVIGFRLTDAQKAFLRGDLPVYPWYGRGNGKNYIWIKMQIIRHLISPSNLPIDFPKMHKVADLSDISTEILLDYQAKMRELQCALVE